MMKTIGSAIGKIIGRIDGYLLGRRLIKICRIFGWDDKNEIADFITAIMYQIEHKHYCVPMFMEDDEK